MTADGMRPLARDCRYFLGDRPCIWHKRLGVVCSCEHYVTSGRRVLLIKLDAMGDVLRTTSLLPVLDRAWGAPAITWITRAEAVPLLRHNPYLSEVVAYGPDAMVLLGARRFDRVINLDAGAIPAGMAGMARADEKIGFVLDAQGLVTASGPAAEAWLRMGVFDDLKRQNSRSFQTIMCDILGLSADGADYVLELTEPERRAAREHLERLGIRFDRPVVGLHTGGGGRWRLKQWEERSFVELVSLMRRRFGAETQIVLFGGPLEREQNARIAAGAAGIADAGCDNEVRHFAALVSCCTVLVCGDTLAMHVALATGCRTVVLFGPTSHAEIELFGRGEKILPDLDCLVCYKTDCDFVPNCMQSIRPGVVLEAVARQLEIVAPRR